MKLLKNLKAIPPGPFLHLELKKPRPQWNKSARQPHGRFPIPSPGILAEVGNVRPAESFDEALPQIPQDAK